MLGAAGFEIGPTSFFSLQPPLGNPEFAFIINQTSAERGHFNRRSRPKREYERIEVGSPNRSDMLTHAEAGNEQLTRDSTVA